MEEGINALVLRSPENVLYVSEHWPVTGWSLLVFKSTGEATLMVPRASSSSRRRARQGY